MALDPATELIELDAILGSTDDPDTKRARIAQLYEEPAANDPGGLSPEATAMGGAGGMGGMGPTGAPPGNVPDVPVPVPGAGGAGGASGMGGSGGTLDLLPPEVIAQSGASGPGNMPAGAPMPPPMAATDASPVRPAPARVTIIPETTVKPGTKKPAGTGPVPGTPEWLTQSMEAEGLTQHRPPKEPIGRPVTAPEDAAMRQLEEEQLTQTRQQAEAEAQAIQAGARAELAAIERGQIIDAELAKRELERQNNLAAMERQYGDMLAEAEAEPIDSERLWNSKSTGEKVLSKIALFLGTIGSVAAGSPNLVLQKMEADIDRDINAQKQNKAFQLHKLAAKGSLYGMAKDRFASEQAVDAAMRETAWRKVDAQLKNFHAVAQDPARKAAIEQLMAQTEGRIVESERQRRLINDADTIARQRVQQAGAAQRAGAARKNVEDPRYVPGLGFARTVKEAQDMRQAQADYSAGKRQFARAKGFARDFSSKIGSTTLETGSKEFHEADALSQSLKNQVAKSFGGVITEGDRQAAAKEVPQLTRLWGGLDERLRMAEERYDRNYRSAIESTIIGAPVAPIPQQEGDVPAAPLPQGQMERPIEKPVRSR